MLPETLIGHLDDYDWIYPRGREGRDDVIRWKTLVSSDRTATEQMIMGVLEVPSGAKMSTHTHEPPEVYYVYDGSGEVFIDGQVHSVTAGSVLFVSANLVHGVRNNSGTTLRLMWMFAGDSYQDIEYHGAETDF